MSEPLRFLALDLGAESGRAVLGLLSDGRLQIRELHRFPNGPVRQAGGLHWDVHRLFEEIKTGMRSCLEQTGVPPLCLGVDTWGVDFGLLDKNGALLGLPFAYRDERTRGAMEGFFTRLPRETIYRLTGIQFLPFNTVFQLFSMVRGRSPLLERADTLLFMPDIFHFFLTGERVTEYSMATTSQLYNPTSHAWSKEIIEALGLSPAMMREPVAPGTLIGPLREEHVTKTGFGNCQVIASLTHDTAAAVAAVPAEGTEWAYISSGTWSLVGVETDAPVINERSRELNITNEGGIGTTTRLLKNITGLWLVQQCRKAWERSASGSTAEYEDLTQQAEQAEAFRTFIDPDSPDFLNPPDMPSAIQDYARRTGQPIPEKPGAFVRCILESLALKYRQVLGQLEALTGRSIRTIHVIGGGAKNTLLNRFTAEASGRAVIAGPAEATACGNILGQALALGYVRSPTEARDIIRNSTPTTVFHPENDAAWENPRQRFLDITGEDA